MCKHSSIAEGQSHLRVFGSVGVDEPVNVEVANQPALVESQLQLEVTIVR